MEKLSNIAGMDWRDCEGVARDILSGADVDRFPVDLHALAAAYGVTLLPAGSSASAGNVAIYREEATEAQTRFRQAHEFAHVPLKAMGYRGERVTQAIAALLICPTHLMKEHMRATGGDLGQLVSDAVVSWEVAAYRFIEVYTGVATIWDVPGKPRRTQSRWLNRAIPMTSIERTDADECRRSREHVRRGGLSGTYYVGGDRIERVISVWELDELCEARAGWLG